MTVRELIEALSQIKDQDLKVMVKGYEGGINDAIVSSNESNTPKIYTIERNVNEEWYYGRHEITEEDTPLKKDKVERAIILIG
jgi:hypothetical protein